MQKTQLGLDVGEKKIKLVELRMERDRYQVAAYGSVETPPGSVDGGLVTDPRRLGEALGGLVRRAGVNRSSPLVSAVSGQQVYNRLISLPRMKREDLKSAALYQASGFLPLNIEEVTADVYPVREYTDDEGEKTEVFFVATRRTQVDALFDACSSAGLGLKWVEIEPLGLARVYYPQLTENSDSLRAVLNIGADQSYISFFKNGLLVMVRTINFGCSAFYGDTGDVPGRDTLAGVNTESEGFTAIMEDFVAELSRSLSYAQIQLKLSTDLLLLTGGGSRVAGMADYISRALEVRCLMGQMGEHLLMPPGMDEPSQLELRHEFPVVMGLALRGWY